jgi:hypothetical protein
VGGGGVAIGTTFNGRGEHKFRFAATKVPRQCSLVLLVKVGLVKVRRLEVEPEAHLNNIKNSVRTAKKTQHFTITNINWLTLFKEIIVVYSENHTKNINALGRQNEELTEFKAGIKQVCFKGVRHCYVVVQAIMNCEVQQFKTERLSFKYILGKLKNPEIQYSRTEPKNKKIMQNITS